MKITKMMLIMMMFFSMTSLFLTQKNNSTPLIVEDKNDEVLNIPDLPDKKITRRQSDSLILVDKNDDDEVLLDDENKVSAYIFLKQINQDDISKILLSYGIDDSIYFNEASFMIFARNQFGNDEQAIFRERKRYQALRLKAIKELTLDVNNSFIAQYGINESQITYLSLYTTTLIIEVNQSMLNLIENDPNVTSISLYENLVNENS